MKYLLSILNTKLNQKYFLAIVIIYFLIFIFSNGLYFNKLELVKKKINFTKEENKLFCIIFTAPHKFYELLPLAAFHVWARKCDDYRFISVMPNNTNFTTWKFNSYQIEAPIRILQPDGLESENYDNLTYKVLFAFKHVYKEFGSYDWYLKADDDTYVNVDNLREFLLDKNSSLPVTYGYDFKPYLKEGYNSGKILFLFFIIISFTIKKKYFINF